MQVLSDRFGPVDIDEQSVIDFPEGIPGLRN